jgi:hypothetical protein
VSAVREYGELLRRPAYLRLWGASLASVGGLAISQLCFVWIVFAETHAAWAVAWLAIVGGMGVLTFSLLGGILADRYDRRRLMVACDLLRAASVVALLGYVWFEGFDIAAYLGLGFVLPGLSVAFTTAEETFLPAVIPRESLPSANGLLASATALAAAGGAAAAGVVIVTVGPLAGLAVCPVSFLVSASLLASLHRPAAEAQAPAPEVAREAGAVPRGLADAARWVGRARDFLQLLVSSGFYNLCAVIPLSFAVVYATVTLGGSALVFSGLVVALAIGGILGPLLLGRSSVQRHAGLWWLGSFGFAAGAVTLGLGVAPSIPLAVAGFLLLGLTQGFAGALWITLAQRIVPTAIQGRVFALDTIGSTALVPVGAYLGVRLIGAFGPGEAFAVDGAAWLAGTAVLFALSTLRRLSLRGGGRPLSGPTLAGAEEELGHRLRDG